MFVVFDANYRLDLSDRHVAALDSPAPPLDAVNALHRYRDAVMVRWNRERPTGIPRGSTLPLERAVPGTAPLAVATRAWYRCQPAPSDEHQVRTELARRLASD